METQVITNAAVVQRLCKGIVARVEGIELGKGKRAADAALNMFAGAAYVAEACGSVELAKHITNVAVLMVATRGYSEVELMAAGK
jgi:hypothetical protein